MTLRQAMIGWIEDAEILCFKIPSERSTRYIKVLIERHYQGGMTQFLADSSGIVS